MRRGWKPFWKSTAALGHRRTGEQKALPKWKYLLNKRTKFLYPKRVQWRKILSLDQRKTDWVHEVTTVKGWFSWILLPSSWNWPFFITNQPTNPYKKCLRSDDPITFTPALILASYARRMGEVSCWHNSSPSSQKANSSSSTVLHAKSEANGCVCQRRQGLYIEASSDVRWFCSEIICTTEGQRKAAENSSPLKWRLKNHRNQSEASTTQQEAAEERQLQHWQQQLPVYFTLIECTFWNTLQS